MAASSSSKRRGAPPGNQNARKHGFYSSQNPAYVQGEGNPLALDLQSEIDFTRQTMQRVIALGGPQSYRQAVDYLRPLGLAATALTRLVRAHRCINPALDPRDQLTCDIQQAPQEVHARLVAGELD